LAPVWKIAVTLVCVAGVAAGRAGAAELQARTSRAYDAYLEEARRAFVSRVRSPAHASPTGHDGFVAAGPGREDGIIGVPGGLVHHWIGRTLVRGAALEQIVNISASYSAYSMVYRSIIASKVLDQDGNTYRVLMRLKESEAGISAVLEIRSTIQYFESESRTVYAISNADEIREVKKPGHRDERLLPPGRDSGYLWRANTFTYFREERDGVYVEMETLGLSRRFPPLLGWMIEPIARRLGRKSVQTSLEEFRAAVRTMSAATPAQVPSQGCAQLFGSRCEQAGPAVPSVGGRRHPCRAQRRGARAGGRVTIRMCCGMTIDNPGRRSPAGRFDIHFTATPSAAGELGALLHRPGASD
jgi:hypothetical protein